MKMKQFSLSLILIFLTNSSFLYAASPVLDSDGDVVRPGVEYYVVGPSGDHGSLAPSSRKCPSGVIEKGLETVNPFHPLMVQPFNSMEPVILENSTQLFVLFSQNGMPISCGIWAVNYTETGRSYVRAIPVKVYLHGMFRVVLSRADNVYKFTTRKSDAPGSPWLDTVIVKGNNIDRMAVADQPNDVAHEFVFIKKDSGAIQSAK